MLTNQPIAHCVTGDGLERHLHPLEEHLLGVAGLASGFAKVFNAQEMAYLAGLWHDLGKYSHAFQARLAKAAELGPDAAREGHGKKVDHSSAGAIWAWERLRNPGLPLAFAIAGHHAGLPDYGSSKDSRAALQTRLTQTDLLTAAQAGGVPASLLEPTPSAGPPLPPGWDPALWVRMLFSCLVDADYLDTEAFMRPDQAAQRGGWPSLAELEPRLTRYLAEKTAQACPSTVNQVRAEVLAACREAAKRPPGVHTLTVPTGGGKTLSSLAFALGHALAHGLERVIYVIPYTSIIEQTARVFREALGADAVLEHHSNLDPTQDTYAADLASENWDAPVIVTTAVQFFESLFAARPGRCRKLHRIAGGVVVLDEAQLTPAQFLQPILAILGELTAHYRVSLVVCTATQPAWEPIQTMDLRFAGLPSAGELAPDPAGLHQRLKRVRVELPPDLDTAMPWEEIAQSLQGEPSALCIVNTRRQAQTLAALLPQAIHLSAAMCAQHRGEVIDRVKTLLKDGEPTLVISTTLVECGVDFSFPVVYRALAGLDSIAQAAGRCNREGELPDLGRVVVFIPPEPAPPGHMRQAAECARRLLADRPEEDPLAPKRFTAFFRELYWLKGKDLDTKGIQDKLKAFKFRTAAEAFQMIEEDGPPVLTLYGQGAELVDQLRREGPSRELLRRLQRYTVTVPARDSAAWLAQGWLELLPGDLLAQSAPGLYHPRFGLGETDDPWPPARLMS